MPHMMGKFVHLNSFGGSADCFCKRVCVEAGNFEYQMRFSRGHVDTSYILTEQTNG